MKYEEFIPKVHLAIESGLQDGEIIMYQQYQLQDYQNTVITHNHAS